MAEFDRHTAKAVSFVMGTFMTSSFLLWPFGSKI